ncbi:MAG: response regulator, partial [Bryobacteraceae bacterium]
MDTPIRVLVVEDSEDDAALLVRELKRNGYEATWRRVDSPDMFLEAVELEPWDLILADYVLPRFSGMAALKILKNTRRDIPLILVSGKIGEDIAVDAMKAGASDYVLKNNLKRLGVAVTRELREAEGRRSAKQAVSALRQTGATLAALMEVSPLAIFTVDPAGRVGAWSRAAEQVFGYSEDETVGRPLPMAGGNTVPPGCDGDRRTWKRRDGTSVEIAVWTRALDSVVLVMAADISERDRLEEQVRQSQKLEAIGRLAGGVAHDFNNMLTVMMGYCQMTLARPDLPEAVRGNVDEMLKASERAAALTRQLLAFSRRQMIQPRVLDLNQVLTGFEGMLRRLIGEHVELRLELGEESGHVRADAAQIEQIVLNLVLNARDSMPGGGRITVATGSAEMEGGPEIKPGSYRVLSVADTGHGMTPEVQKRLFEPFFTTKELGHGTGLGLSTVYGAVKQNGGAIEVRSEAGTGSTFTVYLPRVAESLDVPRPVETAGRIDGAETVFVVEDEAPLRGLIRSTLEPYGYRVLEAPDGGAALVQLDRAPERVDLLLTDIVMPRMSGVELAGHLRVSQPGLCVLFMSGYSEGPPDAEG